MNTDPTTSDPLRMFAPVPADVEAMIDDLQTQANAVRDEAPLVARSMGNAAAMLRQLAAQTTGEPTAPIPMRYGYEYCHGKDGKLVAQRSHVPAPPVAQPLPDVVQEARSKFTPEELAELDAYLLSSKSDVRAFVESLELPWLNPEFGVKDLAVQAIEAYLEARNKVDLASYSAGYTQGFAEAEARAKAEKGKLRTKK